jgi:hypothetical protein
MCFKKTVKNDKKEIHGDETVQSFEVFYIDKNKINVNKIII